MVLIDGPRAYKREIAHSRYFALPFLKDILEEKHVIFLDDANRNGEKDILQMWNNEFGIEFRLWLVNR